MYQQHSIYTQASLVTGDIMLAMSSSKIRYGKYFYSEKYLSLVKKTLSELNKIEIWLNTVEPQFLELNAKTSSRGHLDEVRRHHTTAQRNIENIISAHSIGRFRNNFQNNGYKRSYAFGSTLLKSTNIVCPFKITEDKYNRVLKTLNQALFICPKQDTALLTAAALASEKCKLATSLFRVEYSIMGRSY
jgi:hypothetical protein